MPTEKKSKGVKTETVISPSLKKRFAAKCKKQNISQSQVLRDLIQAFVKK